MELLIVFAVVLAVVAVVGAPLRGRARNGPDPEATAQAELADLDRRTGKLSDEDHRLLDAELRAEAVGLLKRIDTVRARSG